DTPATSLLGLISQRVYDHAGGHPPTAREPEPPQQPALESARAELIEGIISESEDETLLERYLAGEPLSEAELIADLETAIARGTFHPATPVCAPGQVGLAALLEVITRAFPSPTGRPLPPVTGLDGSPREALTADPAGPLVAQIVRTTLDPYVG